VAELLTPYPLVCSITPDVTVSVSWIL